MLFCVLHHPMDAKTHNIPPGDKTEEDFQGGSGEWVQAEAAHNQEC
jgi:hypothetical protein